jgi:hypothetical protein
MAFEGSALFRYYQRIPSTGSSSSSGTTPPALNPMSNASSSQSVAACTQSIHTSSQSGGMSVCNKLRKRKVTDGGVSHCRSNPAVILLNPDDLLVPSIVPIVDQSIAESVVEVIALSSDGSTTTVDTDIAVSPCNRKGKSKLPVCDEIDDCSDDELVLIHAAPKKKRKKSYESSRKFQDTWAARLPWAELYRGSDGLYESVKCLVCSTITDKPKILGPKWDTLIKHGGKRKAIKNMAGRIKKGQWYIARNCKHLRFEQLYAARSVVTVAQQVVEVTGERARKRQQFATVLYILREGRPMLEYQALQPLFSFLGVPEMPKRHWSDPVGWELAQCLYQQVQLKTQAVLQEARFFSITCDEVTTLDTQSWISIHGYVCENWTRKPMLLSLERVVEGGGADNLTKVIINAIKTFGGVQEAEMATRLASFGAGNQIFEPKLHELELLQKAKLVITVSFYFLYCRWC